MSMTAGQLVIARSTDAQSPKGAIQRTGMTNSGIHTSFRVLKQIDAGVLNVGYAEEGDVNAPAVILLHGWPYDIHSYVDVAPLLASAGYRVIVPYLRGYGPTRFLSGETFRNGQQSALAVDTIALMDALRIEKAIVAGFDWGRQDGGHRGGAMARALQGAGLRQRLSDRQPGSRQGALASKG